MTDATKLDRSASGLPFPPATSRESLTVAQLADLDVAAYKGRDSLRLHYLSDWATCASSTSAPGTRRPRAATSTATR